MGAPTMFPATLRPVVRRGARLGLCLLPALLAACGTMSHSPSAPVTRAPVTPAGNQAANERAAGVPVMPAAGSGRGGYYKDDGPGENPPPNLINTPDAIPRVEPYARATNKPYTVFGKTYTPMLDEREFVQRGTATWYGKKFHGQRTSSGEPYDMYKMTAAHPTLPIPSYARVTNLQNGNQVIVRINDRGPFHSTRIIDLSYTAALKLGYLGPGSHEVQVERLLPAEIARINAQRRDGIATPAPVMLAAAPAPVSAPASNGAPSASQLAAEAMLRSDAPLPQERASQAASEPAPLAQAPAPAMTPVALAPAPAPTPLAAAVGRFYLQLGAFSQAAHAESSRSALAPVLGSVPAPAVVQQGGLFKLLSGPFASRSEAQEAARRLQAGQDWQGRGKPLVVERDEARL